MTTEEIIKALRNSRPLGPITLDLMLEAAARLESIQWELTQAIAERTPHEIERVKTECGNQQLNTRPEPSRLEIAAGIYAARGKIDLPSINRCFREADALIKAAKEAK